MAKKVKCINCGNAIRSEIPSKEFLLAHTQSHDYYKSCCVDHLWCGETIKPKAMDNEQYCKKYKEADDSYKKYLRSAEKEWNDTFREIEEEREEKRLIEEKQKIWKRRMMNEFMKSSRR